MLQPDVTNPSHRRDLPAERACVGLFLQPYKKINYEKSSHFLPYTGVQSGLQRGWKPFFIREKRPAAACTGCMKRCRGGGKAARSAGSSVAATAASAQKG